MKIQELMQLRILLSFFFICSYIFASGQRAEDYKTLSEDGSWCWFSDPRSVYHQGKKECTYTGFVTSEGDIVITSKDHKSGLESRHTIYKNLEVDDHVNPSILFLPDGRLMVFFTKHNGLLYYTTSELPEDISKFGKVNSLNLGKMSCYTNPVLLSGEANRIYLFYRGGYDWKPSYITSDDLGKNWSKPKSFVSKEINVSSNRPYTKVVSDGIANIHFAFTDGHPRDESQNSIYYLRYEGGSFYDASGKVLGDVNHLPIRQESIPKAYDGVEHNQRAWIWDIALNEQSNPVIAFTTMPEETNHFYNYGIWNGKEWITNQICSAGSSFPRFVRKKEERNREPHYSGGISIDHNKTNTVYLSKPHNDRYEIEEWTTMDNGKSFSSNSVTTNSLRDNIRPVVVRNAPKELSPRVLWMNVDHYEHYTKFHTAIKGNQPANKFSGKISEDSVKAVLTAVADWQIDNFHLVKHHTLDWTNGALYAGMMTWAKTSSDKKYLDWLNRIGWKFHWQPYYRMYHADDVVVSQMYLDMYEEKKADKNSYRILGPTKARLDYVINNPSKGTLLLNYRDAQTLERWSWCDALFMAPPVYVKMANITGDDKYLSFMDQEFKATYDFLYDQEEHLFYRDHRFFPDVKLESNGEKIFWGRGNGWVLGGLVSMLKDLPKDSKYRPFYEELFKEMSEKVVECQGKEGFWHASMLDPGSYPNPETSSSAFFCYALAYGINSGLLEKDKYLPVVTKSWEALVSAVHPDGKLGWVQPIGEDPKKVTAEMTEVYGVGAFLLAGTEMLELIE